MEGSEGRAGLSPAGHRLLGGGAIQGTGWQEGGGLGWQVLGMEVAACHPGVLWGPGPPAGQGHSHERRRVGVWSALGGRLLVKGFLAPRPGGGGSIPG